MISSELFTRLVLIFCTNFQNCPSAHINGYVHIMITNSAFDEKYA